VSKTGKEDSLQAQATQKSKAASSTVPQTKLKDLLTKKPGIKTAKFVKNVPIAVYPLNPFSLASIPSPILEGMGELDKATYPNKDAYLKANFGGAMALQVAHGKLDAYPIPPDQYSSNYKAVSLEEMQTKNPKNATALIGILGDLSTIPGVCGALKTVSTEMVLASDLGFPVKDLLKIEAPWGGDQTKDAGKEAYLVVCDAPYLVNLDESGLPVAYIKASEPQQEDITIDVVRDSTTGAAGYRFVTETLTISGIDSQKYDLAHLSFMQLGDTIVGVNDVPVTTNAEYMQAAKGVPKFRLTLRRL
jgi:hypothetical protein